MNSLKTIALNTVAIILALAILGVFASLGLVLIGALFCAGIIGLMVAAVQGAFAKDDKATEAPQAQAAL